ncbi:MAG: NBR1-Ig-like domain-containing protein [Anaerolineae bacterium]|nr:NBR1-Ig-like domain-containing protein [Anaerolineae bacterium]MDK1119223.1 NBR1-Ig-like domain-containing protein [Anaerolineae bacterium]
MHAIKYSWLILIVGLIFGLSACNLGQEPEATPDVALIFTSAVETVAAQFSFEQTQTALAAPSSTQPPTATLIPTFSIESSSTPLGGTPLATFGFGTQASPLSTISTATPIAILSNPSGPVCMDSAFIADITHPDNSVVQDNTWLEKFWSIQNTGTCTWDDGFSLQPVLGDAKGEWLIDTTKKFVDPGEIVEISIEIKTPSTGGDWGGCWKMEGDNGQLFGTLLCLLVNVQ